VGSLDEEVWDAEEDREPGYWVEEESAGGELALLGDGVGDEF
jgi:hypothetical protein